MSYESAGFRINQERRSQGLRSRIGGAGWGFRNPLGKSTSPPSRIKRGKGGAPVVEEPWLGCGEILLFQDSAVVEFVAGDCIGQGADGHFVVVGDAAPGPGLLVQIAEQG